MTDIVPIIPLRGQKTNEIMLLRELGTVKAREKNDLFFFDGLEIVRRAFVYGAEVKFVIFSDDILQQDEVKELQELAYGKCGLFSASKGLMAKAVGSKPVPSCVAVATRKVADLQSILETNKLLLLAHDLELLDNLGMLLRTAEAANVGGVILAGNTADPFHRKSVRGSRGAVFCMPISIIESLDEILTQAHALGFQTVASSANLGQNYDQIDFTKPSIIITGNEHTGLPDEATQACTHTANIPMLGKINSLNVSVAGSILLFEAVRQKSR